MVNTCLGFACFCREFSQRHIRGLWNSPTHHQVSQPFSRLFPFPPLSPMNLLIVESHFFSLPGHIRQSLDWRPVQVSTTAEQVHDGRLPGMEIPYFVVYHLWSRGLRRQRPRKLLPAVQQVFRSLKPHVRVEGGVGSPAFLCFHLLQLTWPSPCWPLPSRCVTPSFPSVLASPVPIVELVLCSSPR